MNITESQKKIGIFIILLIIFISVIVIIVINTHSTIKNNNEKVYNRVNSILNYKKN
jgi:hypothetical protein